MNYTVNLGCWGSIFAVPTDVVDKYIKIAGSAQLKVLLYILRKSGQEFSTSDIAAALNMDAYDVKDCIEFWTSFGIIAVNNGEIIPAAAPSDAPTPAPTIPKPIPEQKVTAPEPIQEAPQPETPTAAPQPPKQQTKLPEPVIARPIRPDPLYIAERIKKDKDIEALLNEAQFILGRPVSTNENAGLIMMHDNDGLPSAVILMLLAYGVENQKGMRQIEIMGANWAKEGIVTLEQADEKIRQMQNSKEQYHKIQSLFGLEFRKASQKEEEMYSRWLTEWKFSDELLKEAYDICVNAKGKYIPNYVNTILHNWHENGVKTLEQARSRKKKSSSGGSNARASSFDVDDLSDLSMFND